MTVHYFHGQGFKLTLMTTLICSGIKVEKMHCYIFITTLGLPLVIIDSSVSIRQ